MAEEGPPGEDLVEGVLAVHRVPAAEPVLSLEVRRRDDVASDDLVRDARCIDLEGPHGLVRDTIASCLVPVRVAEAPWRVLEQHGDDVCPIRGAPPVVRSCCRITSIAPSTFRRSTVMLAAAARTLDDTVREIAGTIELRKREVAHPPSRPGAVLRVVYPALPRAERKLG